MVRAALASTYVIRVSGFGRAIDFGISDLVVGRFWLPHDLGKAIQLAGGDLLDDRHRPLKRTGPRLEGARHRARRGHRRGRCLVASLSWRALPHGRGSRAPPRVELGATRFPLGSAEPGARILTFPREGTREK